MKDLKDYITEAIKPPRLSAKNKDLWNNGLIDEKGIWEWLEKTYMSIVLMTLAQFIS